MSELLTKTERIRRAMDRAEQASVDLLYHAERLANAGQSAHDTKCQRREVMGAARRYSRAMDAITRIRA